jgi:hypothetical protein
VPNADSIKADVARRLERVGSIRSSARQFADSIRAEARKRMAAEADSQ